MNWSSTERDAPQDDPVPSFHPLAREHVARHLAQDPTGRLLQLARTCPGALLFAAGLEARGGALAQAARSLLAWAVEGRRLPLVLLGGALGLLEEELTRAGDGAGGCERAIRSMGAGTVEQWAARLRLLVRRASAAVSPLDLCGLPPPFLAAEDIAAGEAGPAWYAAARMAWDACLAHDLPAEAWSFVNRHLLFLAGAVGEHADIPDARAFASALARNGEETGRWPGRNAAPGPWLAVLQAPAGGRGSPATPAARLGALLERLRRMDLGEVVAVRSFHPVSGWGDGPAFAPFEGQVADHQGVILRPISSALELATEGRRMENCVAQYCGLLVGGARWIFGGRILGEPATVEVRRVGARFVIAQARGVRNAPLKEDQRRALRGWLRQVNAARRRPKARMREGREALRGRIAPSPVELQPRLPYLRETPRRP